MNKRKDIFIFVIMMLASYSCNEPPPDTIPSTMLQEHISWPSLADSPWPMYRHDPQLTGRSQYEGPSLGEVVFRGDSVGEIFSNPSIDGNGNILFTQAVRTVRSGPQHLRSIKPDGTLNWEINLGGRSGSTPLITAEGTFYIVAEDETGNGYLLKGDLEGNILWKYHFNSIPTLTTHSVNISKDGSLIFTCGLDQSFYAIKSDGTLGWKFDLGDTESIGMPAISPDGNTIYFVTDHQHQLFALTLEGKLRWQKKYSDNPNHAVTPPTVDAQGNIYVNANAALYALNDDGSIRWENDERRKGARAINGISIGPDGEIHLVSDGTYNVFDYSGQPKWELEGSFISYASLDKVGNTYFGLRFSDGLYSPAIPFVSLASFDPHGQVRYSLAISTHHSVFSPPCIVDGQLYAGLYGYIGAFLFSVK
ncbi:PQQ-like beta-propeller repeat protein [Caldithrix abyssi]|nr:PQQ-like beta-propeller repeat protein [Caldithrix abyssi]